MSRPAASSASSAVPAAVSLVKRSDRQSGRVSTSRLSNAYLQDGARLVVILKLQQYVTILGLCVLVLLLANFSSTNYRVFATSEEGKLIVPPPVDQPVPDNYVIMWVVDAVVQATTMGFYDYDLRMQNCRTLFTDRGWESYTRFLRQPYNKHASLRALLDGDRLLMWSTPRTPPEILQKGLVGGVMTYRIRQEIKLKRSGTRFNGDDRPKFEITIERVRPEINPSGLAIAQWRLVD